MKYRSFITSLLEDAGKIAQEGYGKAIASIKGGDQNQVVTETDIAISTLLVSRIRESYPTDNIIDEETRGVDNGSEMTWVIDPIDGTSDFAKALPMYGVMVGLLRGAEPIAGGVLLPAFDELYYAEQGEGAFCNDTPIRVSDDPVLRHALIAYALDAYPDKPHDTEKEAALFVDISMRARNMRSSNSCFDQMAVATGKYGAWLNRTTKIWDNVAPEIIIKEAGGQFTDFIGRTMDYSNPMTKVSTLYTVCAAPKALHTALQTIIHSHTFMD